MKPASFKDHFSAHACGYARYRPRYPEELFAYLASLCWTHTLAWDCGTGNGQAAHGLAPHFAHIVATDASADQIANAVPHERVTYHVTPASQSPLAPGTADLVTVAQALHWFDLDTFYPEVQRVLKPEGVLAVWTYTVLQINPLVDAAVHRYYADVVEPYWPPERQIVAEGYRTISFPFDEEEPPYITLELTWSLDDLLGYLGTWSATQRFVKAHGTNPLDQVEEELARAWGDPLERKLTRWPMHLRVGRRRG